MTDKIKIDPKMLGSLICPKSRGPLVHDTKTNELISKKAKLAYPIRDGVPIMLNRDVQNIDLMILANFCRNCLSKWWLAEAETRGHELDLDAARQRVYGMDYRDWKAARL